MKKPRKRLLVVTAAVAATLLVASCSYGSGDPSRSKTSGGAHDGNVSFATTTPNWILPVSAPGKTQGENAMFTQLIYPALFSYKLDAKNEFNIDERHSVAKPPPYPTTHSPTPSPLRTAHGATASSSLLSLIHI